MYNNIKRYVDQPISRAFGNILWDVHLGNVSVSRCMHCKIPPIHIF